MVHDVELVAVRTQELLALMEAGSFVEDDDKFCIASLGRAYASNRSFHRFWQGQALTVFHLYHCGCLGRVVVLSIDSCGHKK